MERGQKPGAGPIIEDEDLGGELIPLLQGGRKIQAIKVYRENYDVSLARAKYAIEQIESGQTLRPEAGFEAMRAVAQAAPQAALAAKFMDYVLSPDGQAILAKWGFIPAKP